ncbi:MAG TPA: hypothetical protein PKV86_14070 [Syntrophobacteraceae bacterium]|nr:hypothetical protein [Syntrophobacteraceae bacterium]
MVAHCFRKIRIASILVMALLLCSCAVYPAFQDPNIDYDGRWGTWNGGYGPYGPGGPYAWYPGTIGSSYHYWGGDDPHRYWGP